jgi:hypothetical protein
MIFKAMADRSLAELLLSASAGHAVARAPRSMGFSGGCLGMRSGGRTAPSTAHPGEVMIMWPLYKSSLCGSMRGLSMRPVSLLFRLPRDQISILLHSAVFTRLIRDSGQKPSPNGQLHCDGANARVRPTWRVG